MPRNTRRDMLAALGTSVALGLAGCNSASNGSDTTGDQEAMDTETDAPSGTATDGVGNETADGSDESDSNAGEDPDTETTDGSGSRPEEQPARLIERYYMRQNEVESEGDIDQYLSEIMALLHSESPLIESIRQGRKSERLALDRPDVTDVGTDIINRDLSASELETEFGLSMVWDVDQTTINEVAQENVIVATRLERASTESDNNEITWLVTKENDEWVLFVNMVIMTPDG